MRNDQPMPNDRDTIERENAVPGRRPRSDERPSSSDQADGTSADTPAPLRGTAYPADVEEAGLSEEEIAHYRRRVADGLYNTREVADEVARRMMRRGDI